ncbi:MAG: ComF family protein [Desulfobacterales bacterium]|nr:ComF family protein [Desulfobacterales bacterium]
MEFTPVTSPACPVCGLMFTSREGEDHLCGDCQEHKGKFHVAKSAGIHNKALMTAIHRLKYNGKIQLAKPLGMLLFTALIDNYNINDIDRIIPVPLHTKRLRQRGFNQAYLLVKNWEKLARAITDESPHFEVNRSFLIRNRHTAPQTLLNREKRKLNLKNAFEIKNPLDISEKNVLLVDDVFTTGSTVDECSKVLLNKGAKRVDVLTLSRAV